MDKEEPHVLTKAEVEYFVTGFLRVLRRYRFMSTLGWLAVMAGFVSLYVGWSHGMPHGLIDLALSCLAILSGILVVQQAIASLQEYVSLPAGASDHPAVTEIRVLMEQIRKGGWREATGAIRRLNTIVTNHDIPQDDSTAASTFLQER